MDILWLHGFPLGPASWNPQMATMGGVAPDLMDAEAATVDAMADRALAAAEEAGWESFAVVGLSLGGYVALRLADRLPHRIAALVLADTRAEPDPEERKALRDRMIADVARQGPEAASGFLRKELARANPDLERFALGMALGRDPAAIMAALRAMRNRPDARPTLGRLRMPTLVMVGERDSLVSVEEARELAAAIPGARLAVVEEAGHFSNLEAPGAFNRIVEEFLAATRVTAGSPRG